MSNPASAELLPEVQYLPALLRRVEQGEIRIPAFQREFVWQDSQILALLESIYRGYPIGSLLFWQVKERLLQVDRQLLSPFPDVPEKYPLRFVLDGFQRLSTLYGVFHHSPTGSSHRFDVIFDLDKDQFRHWDADDDMKRCIRMSFLFSPREFLGSQKALSDLPDADTLLDKAVRLHSSFQQYMIPTVTISDRTVADVVAIFERVNSTGTQLNALDFMRAATWSEQFDLNHQLNYLHNDIAIPTGLDISPETLAKVLALMLGKAPTLNSMLELRDTRPSSLHEGIARARQALLDTSDFLRQRFRIFSYDYIPYEGQLLVLTAFFSSESRTPAQLLAMEQWFWATSFNETLRGKPDHYVVRMINRLGLSRDLSAMKERLTIMMPLLVERRFVKGAALSGAVAAMFAVSGARSLVTGEVIPPETYMSEFAAKHFETLISASEESFAWQSPSNKVIANTVLVSELDSRRVHNTPAKALLTSLRERLGTDDAMAVLESQFITPSAVHHISRGSTVDYLFDRAQAMWKRIAELTGEDR